jgi:hypothetical protein
MEHPNMFMTWPTLDGKLIEARIGRCEQPRYSRQTGDAAGTDPRVWTPSRATSWPRSPDTVSKWFHQIAQAAGVSTTLHGLRH